MSKENLSNESAKILSELSSKKESEISLDDVAIDNSKSRKLLELIAIPHWFNKDISNNLISIYEKYANEKVVADYPDLLKYTFVSEYKSGYYVLHERVRDLLIDHWRNDESNLLILLSRGMVNYLEQQTILPNGSISNLVLQGEIIYHELISEEEKGFVRLREIFKQSEKVNNFSQCEFILRLAHEQKRMLSSETFSQIDYYWAWLKILQGFPSDALDTLENINKKNLPQEIVLRIRALEAEALRHLGKYPEALDVLYSLLETYQNQQKSSSEAFILTLIAMVLYKLEQRSGAIKNYEKALNLYGEIEDREGITWVNYNLGILYSFSRKTWEKALLHLEIAKKYWEETNNWYFLASTFQSLGRAFEFGGKWEEALHNYYRNFELCADTDNEVGLASSLLHLGRIYVKLGQWEKAIDSLSRSIEIYARYNMHSPLGDSYRVLADAHREVGNWLKSDNMYDNALREYKKANNKFGQAVVLSHWGEMKVYSEQYSSAARLFRRASGIWKNLEK